MSTDINPEDLPAGYVRTSAGLVVPDASARVIEKWTEDEWNLFQRAARLAVQKGMVFRLFCVDSRCTNGENVTMVDMVVTDNGRVLRCRHADRQLYLADRHTGDKQAKAQDRRNRRHDRFLRESAEREKKAAETGPKPPAFAATTAQEAAYTPAATGMASPGDAPVGASYEVSIIPGREPLEPVHPEACGVIDGIEATEETEPDYGEPGGIPK